MRLIQLAQASGDWAGALQQWRRAADQLPDAQIGATVGATLLRQMDRHEESDAVLLQAAAQFPQSEWIAVAYALNAQDVGDAKEALRRWTKVREQFPHNAYAYAASAAALLRLGQADECDALLKDASQRFPEHVDICVHFVNAALFRSDVYAALQRWLDLERRFAKGHAVNLQIASLFAGQRTDDSGAAGASINEALIDAETRGDWPTAVRLGQELSALVPESVSTQLRCFNAYCMSGQRDKADQLLSSVMSRSPKDIRAAVTYAMMAQTQGDWAEAERRWRSLFAAFADAHVVAAQVGAALREAGRVQESNDLLRRAIEIWPDAASLRINYAFNADAAEDWTEAVRRWDAASRLLPDDESISYCRGTAIWHANINSGLADGKPAAAAAPRQGAAASEEELRDVALAFESLGDDCEFGLIQRKAGAEPIGLFRFAGAGSVENMIHLLNTGFEALGDPKYTRLFVLPNGEYGMRDERGFYIVHTFIKAGSVKEEAFLQQQIRRIDFLRRKLIEDLANCEKIFVYKSTITELTEQQAFNLNRGLLRYGPNVLLGVSLENGDRRAGTILKLQDNVMLGFVDKMMHSEKAPGLAPETWFKLLRDARAAARPKADGPK